MEQIEFVNSGLMTSRIGIGTWAMGGWMWGGTDEAQSIATIHSAIDCGVTLIDTAPVYGFGRSEEIVGKALEGSLRQKVTIATKVGLAWKDGAVYRDSRPARIRKEIEDSLRRLRTDVIDLYQVHWPDFETPIAETARTMEDLRRGPAFGSGGSFLGTAASTAAGVIGGGLLLNSIRSMFGDHTGLGGHERSALGSSSGSAADSGLAQRDRDQDQDQDQDQDDDDQAQEDRDQDQDQDDDAGDFGGDDTDNA
jgi:Aldo/keto reductase family/Uncharacterized protein conserved in bacteria (DUF2076)